MTAPVILGIMQFSDADGHPYAGGTIDTFAPGTSNRKATWLNPNASANNPNPIVLDASGRAVIYGSGQYRLVLRDSVGNQVWDQAGSSIVSDVMAPVMLAPTYADAVHMLGIDALIAAEAAARVAGDAAEATARAARDNALADTINDTRIALGGTDMALNSEVTRATGAEATLLSQIAALSLTVHAVALQGGIAATDLSGHVRITFPVAFSTTVTAFVCSVVGTASVAPFDFTLQATADLVGADVHALQAGLTATTVCNFSWLAAGS